MKTFKYLTIILLVALVACTKETETPSDKLLKINALEGKVEKGPFTQGSTVTIQELSKDISLTGKSFQTDITSNEGDFKIETAIEFVSSYVQVACDGYFFNEVTGELSSSQIRLESIVDISNKRSINVNILTHLTKDRIIYLMKEEKYSYKDAAKKAREELLTSFSLNEYKDLEFEDLSITSGDKGSGALIVISSILLAGRTEAELTEYIASLKETFTTSGTFSETVIKSIKDESKQLNTKDIASKIVSRYKDLGKNILIPDLDYFIDWDGDGIAGNELGDPNVEKSLSFEVGVVNVTKAGGQFRVKINANIPYTNNLDNNQTSVTVDTPFKDIESTETITDNELIINIQPTTETLLNPKIITISSYDGSLVAELKIIQEGDFTNELSNEYLSSIISQAATAFDYTYTIEAFYSNTHTSSSSNWTPFASHTLNSSNIKVNEAWSSLYQLNNYLNSLQEVSGNSGLKRIISLRALLYDHLTTLWGNVPYIIEPITNGDYFPTQTQITDIYNSLQSQLQTSIVQLPDEGEGTYFEVSKNVPRAILAKILIKQEQYTQAFELLQNIISSGAYALNSSRSDAISSASTEMIYAINKETFPTPNHTANIEQNNYLPLVQYSEIVLLAAESAYQIGNANMALTYLNQIRTRDGDNLATINSFQTDLKETWRETMKGSFSYFDFLKRNGLAIDELNIQDYQQLLPIPYVEINTNPNISQNPGY